LLAELRAEVRQIAAGFGGQLPHPLGVLLADAVHIGERFVREHDEEAARGWDAMELLRDLVPHVRDVFERWKAEQPSGIVFVLLESGRIEQHDASKIPPDTRWWCREGDPEWKPHAPALQDIMRHKRVVEPAEWSQSASEWLMQHGYLS
jgi:hypothetical protein